MNKAIKYRLYPNKEQKTMFAKTFGCVRFIYNKMLTDKIDYYKETKQKLNNTPAQYKEKFPWLREVDSLALANAQLHLQTAYSNFFRDKKIGFPKFKSKSNKQSYTTNNQKGSIKIEENSFVKLPKIGLVKTKIHKLPNENYVIKSVTITKTCSGNYYISILFEFKKNIEPHPIDNVIGLDYKSDGLYVDSEGHTCGSPKYYRKSNKKLSRLQRQLSRKQKGSKNRDKQRNKVAKLSEHISNQRKDFLHKKSTEIANCRTSNYLRKDYSLYLSL